MKSKTLTLICMDPEDDYILQVAPTRVSSFSPDHMVVTSEDPSVVEVISDTVIRAKKDGTTTVTVKSKLNPFVRETISITVSHLSVTLAGDLPETEVYTLLHSGDRQYFSMDELTASLVSFESDDPGIADVDNSGILSISGTGFCGLYATLDCTGLPENTLILRGNEVQDSASFRLKKTFYVKVCPDTDHTTLSEHTPHWYDESVFIAHALGVIDDNKYTNSLEAFNYSLQNGYRFFEVDLERTSDKEVRLVCSHNLEEDVTIRDFLSGENSDEYTVLDCRKLIALWSEQPDLYLIADIKGADDNPGEFLENVEHLYDLVRSTNPDLIDHLIIQVYYADDFETLHSRFPELNYFFTEYLIRGLSEEECTAEETAMLETSRDNRLGLITVSRRLLNNGDSVIRTADTYHLNLFIHSVSWPPSRIVEYMQMGVDGFFCNDLSPDEQRYYFESLRQGVQI